MNVGQQKTIYCPECLKETKHTLVVEPETHTIGNITFTGNVVYWKCSKCGDGYDIDSSDIDRKYTAAYREYHNHMLNGEQIKAVRGEMSKTKFVKYLKTQGVNYNLDEYEEIENDTRVQSSAMEITIRKLGGYPEWEGYKTD